MRETCPTCRQPIDAAIDRPHPDEAERCPACGHALVDFRQARSGAPAAFWMPRQAWERLPVYTGEPPPGGLILFRDATLAGVVYRWMGDHWWQVTLSFAPTPPARDVWDIPEPPRSRWRSVLRALAPGRRSPAA